MVFLKEGKDVDGKKRVLIIDDEPIICRGLEKEFIDAGYEAESAGSCDGALEKIKEREFDIVFIDLVLPGKDGVETCREIKGVSPQSKLVFMTGMMETDPIFKEMQFVEAGGQAHYLYKPFLEGEILEVAQKALRA